MDIVFTLVVIVGIYLLQRQVLIPRLEKLDRINMQRIGIGYIDVLMTLHFLLFATYFTYAVLRESDSVEYYKVSSEALSWLSTWGSDSQFVAFLTYPFSNALGLSYTACMMIFAFLGFQGVLLFYLTAREHVFGTKPIFGRFTLTEVIFLLPNIHFWSSSIGKGSTMILALGVVIYGISRYNRASRKLLITAGAFFVYMLRPHILFVLLLGTGTAMFFSFTKVKLYVKVILIVLSLGVIYVISDNLVEYTGSENLNIFESKGISKRANDLSIKANSGVNISNYNQVQKLFTLLYRPLFLDAPGVLGIIVSFENLLYLIFTVQFIRKGIPRWRDFSGFIRIGFFIFFYGAVSLAQIAGNLGIAMRQKAQIMPLFFIVYCKTMALDGERKRIPVNAAAYKP
ncbi:MAG: hypothetical protein ACK5DG_06550 [Chitinophagaceae bacterium]|jgi:hypothetical protein